MLNKIKGYVSIILFGMNCFTYGAYTYRTIHHGTHVEPHQWIITGVCGIMFLLYGISQLKSHK